MSIPTVDFSLNSPHLPNSSSQRFPPSGKGGNVGTAHHNYMQQQQQNQNIHLAYPSNNEFRSHHTPNQPIRIPPNDSPRFGGNTPQLHNHVEQSQKTIQQSSKSEIPQFQNSIHQHSRPNHEYHPSPRNIHFEQGYYQNECHYINESPPSHVKHQNSLLKPSFVDSLSNENSQYVPNFLHEGNIFSQRHVEKYHHSLEDDYFPLVPIFQQNQILSFQTLIIEREKKLFRSKVFRLCKNNDIIFFAEERKVHKQTIISILKQETDISNVSFLKPHEKLSYFSFNHNEKECLRINFLHDEVGERKMNVLVNVSPNDSDQFLLQNFIHYESKPIKTEILDKIFIKKSKKNLILFDQSNRVIFRLFKTGSKLFTIQFTSLLPPIFVFAFGISGICGSAK
jgi:hypothetical protein